VAATENRLARETSPYLLQHAHDPVDWFPFGEEAFERARRLDRPLFLSIGYSACHWCHVMAHESFADPETASQMNDSVVAVKVDREERPDVDAVYMEAVQAATGSGGWPMSVFATSDGKPFFAGTYFPDRPRHGSPSFRQVLSAVTDVWTNRRDDVATQADALSDAVARRLSPQPPPEGAAAAVDAKMVRGAVESAVARLVEIADPEHGGFGTAPKFPQPLFIDLLLRAHVEGSAGPRALEVALRALEAMASGGIWDHVGGGFSRYSVDRRWLVPHFEKMLYDEALLGRAYLHAFQVTGDPRFAQVLDELLGYVLRDLVLEGGALASSEDADSEGEEGRFYLWSAAEMREVLGPELAAGAGEFWGVTETGNFEGRNILHRPIRGDLARPAAIERAREALFEARARRVRPALDDKVLAEWNAMMCATLAESALATGRSTWREAAVALGDVLASELRRPGDGRVLRARPRRGAAPILGFAADVAWMAEAFARLCELTGDFAWAERGCDLAEQLLTLFEDREAGGLFTTGADAEALVVRPRELTDGVIPSATSIGAAALARLAALAARPDLLDAAERLVASESRLLEAAPTAVPELLRAAELVALGTVDVAVGAHRTELVSCVAGRFEPRVVIAWQGPGTGGAEGSRRSPLLEGRADDAAYVCRFGECRLPARSAEELVRELDAALGRSGGSNRPGGVGRSGEDGPEPSWRA
jgi:uncharacterized protein YyaL (SSP411 family)